MKTKFYKFSQNNSGGSFNVDEKVCHRLLIEANTASEACSIAENFGVYFDGCEKGMDCDCCGDRWYFPSELEFPYSYGSFEEEKAKAMAEKYNASIENSERGWGKNDKNVVFETPESYMQYLADNYGWTNPDGRIFYKNGNVSEIIENK